MTTTLPDPSQALIGCMLVDSDACMDVLSAVRAEHVTGLYQEAFRVIEEMVGEGHQVNVETLNGEWKKRTGKPLPMPVIDSITAISSHHNWSLYAEDLIDIYRRNTIAIAAGALAYNAKDSTKPIAELLAEAEKLISDSDPEVVTIETGKEIAQAFIADLEKRHALGGKIPGIGTGFSALDHLIGGFQAKELFVLGARPSEGKTAIACSVAVEACLRQRVPTLFVSLEMSKESIQKRMTALWANVDIRSMRMVEMTEGEMRKCQQFCGKISSSPFYFVNGLKGLTIADISTACRRAVKRHGVKLVIVDYLQKIRPTKTQEKRTYEVAEVSTGLKAIADTNNVAVLALAQISRDKEKDNRMPRPSDLSDSKQIEQDADNIGLLHKHREEVGRTDLILAKQRDGELGLIKLHFEGKYARFSCIDDRMEEPN